MPALRFRARNLPPANASDRLLGLILRHLEDQQRLAAAHGVQTFLAFLIGDTSLLEPFCDIAAGTNFLGERPGCYGPSYLANIQSLESRTPGCRSHASLLWASGRHEADLVPGESLFDKFIHGFTR